MNRIIGFYDKYGYDVNLVDQAGHIVETLYSAGNSAHESTTTVSASEGLPLKTIESYCNQTSQEIAEEKTLEFGGTQEKEDYN